MKIRTFSMFFLIGAAVACGSDKPEKQPETQNTPEEISKEVAAVDADLPEFAMIRVPLVDGVEAADAAEFRVGKDATVAGSDAAVAAQFAAAVRPDAEINELDADTSTQSWSFTQADASDYPGQQQQYPESPQQQYPQDQRDCSKVDCGTTTVHQQGQRQAVYPIKRTRVIRHDTVDVYPQHKVDVYPVRTVRVHPTQTHYNVHPVQTRFQYVNNCRNNSRCTYANFDSRFTNYWPRVQNRGYFQYYYPARSYDYRGYRYYMYCKPSRFFRNYY